MTILVFSKDRALQLDAFLRSFARFVTPLQVVHVIWQSSTLRHRRAYGELFEKYPWVVSLSQTSDFKGDVLSCLPPSGMCVFFVDDVLFIRPWAVVEIPGLSLRLATHLAYCYTMNQPQPKPRIKMKGDHATWRWADGAGDWGYPLSLDGHVFNLTELRAMLESINFTSPNTMESALQRFTPRYSKRYGKCYRESRIVNVPWNRVQPDCDNRFGRNPHTTSDRLLVRWEAGQQIALENIYGVLNESCHQEFPLEYEGRA